jgi:hypothetical protein
MSNAVTKDDEKSNIERQKKRTLAKKEKLVIIRRFQDTA